MIIYFIYYFKKYSHVNFYYILLIFADGNQSWWTGFIKFLKILAIVITIGLFCILLVIGIRFVCGIIFSIYNQYFGGTRNLELFPISTHRGVDGTQEIDQEECVICIAHYHEGDHIRTLPCNHSFHESCLIQWLRRKKTCPICRRRL